MNSQPMNLYVDASTQTTIAKVTPTPQAQPKQKKKNDSPSTLNR